MFPQLPKLYVWIFDFIFPLKETLIFVPECPKDFSLLSNLNTMCIGIDNSGFIFQG